MRIFQANINLHFTFFHLAYLLFEFAFGTESVGVGGQRFLSPPPHTLSVVRRKTQNKEEIYWLRRKRISKNASLRPDFAKTHARFLDYASNSRHRKISSMHLADAKCIIEFASHFNNCTFVNPKSSMVGARKCLLTCLVPQV